MAIPVPYSIAAAADASDRLELVAGADIDSAKREEFRTRWGVTALYEDYEEMVDRERPDVVAVCTGARLHARMAVNVAEAAVPMIYLEKAIACSMIEADSILEACREYKTLFTTGVLRRFDTRYQKARELIANGEIGKLQALVHFAPASLMHGHIHSIDTLMYLAGDPCAIRVRGELRPTDLRIDENIVDEDPHATYHIEFPDGVEAWTIPAGNWEFEALGSEGAIRSTSNGVGWGLRKVKPGGARGELEPVPYEPPAPISPTRWCLEDLVSAYEEGREPLGSIEIAHHATEICLAVAESHRLGGQWLTFPIENRSLYVNHW